MNGAPDDIACGLVRLWTRIYTYGLSEEARLRRLEEVDSDLWEQDRDAPRGPGTTSAWVTIVRLLTGVPDDLAWRLEQVDVMKPVHRTGIVVLSLAAVVAILIAIAQVGKPAALPAPYRPVLAAWVSSPPPPPPAEVPGSPFASRSSTPVTLKYAQASYTSAGNQLLPKKTHDARPVHPPLAVTAGIHGTVILEATIDGEGHVGEPRILQSVPMLDQSAVDAVRQWSFEPTIVNGKPVPVTIRVTVDYTASM